MTDLDDHKKTFDKPSHEKAVGEGLINGVYTETDAKLTAERQGLSWAMVEYWAGKEYESQQVAGHNSWN